MAKVLDVSDEALAASVAAGTYFRALGLVTTSIAKSLSFLDDVKYLDQLLKNTNISGVLLTPEIYRSTKFCRDLTFIVRDDPRWSFYSLHNYIVEIRRRELPISVVAQSASIAESAVVARNGVIIAQDVIIEPRAVILPGVYIGANTTVRAGAVIGVEGFEHKRTSKGILSVRHDGGVTIGENVEIGANNTIARGLMGKDTSIGDDTKLDCLVHVGHCAQIGKRCIIPACAMIAGSVDIGDDVWIGPNSSISSQLTIGSDAFITIGSVVTKDVGLGGHVTGNFAIDHQQFLLNLRSSIQRQ